MTVPRLDRRRRILSRRRAAAWVRRPAAATAGPDLPRDGRQERGRGPPQPLHLRLLAEAKDTITKRSTSKKCSFVDVVGWAPPDKRPMKHFKYFHIVLLYSHRRSSRNQSALFVGGVVRPNRSTKISFDRPRVHFCRRGGAGRRLARVNGRPYQNYLRIPVKRPAQKSMYRVSPV